MIVLLAPSETKTPGEKAGGVDLDSMWNGTTLRNARRTVGDALVKVSARDDALDILKVGPNVAHMVADNMSLWDNPTSPAYRIYSGVLYDAMDAPHWTKDMRHQAKDHVFVQSALWGLIDINDQIPAYRLSMDTDLPGVGKLGAMWKKALNKPMDDVCHGQLVLDCRSGAYKKAWLPTAKTRRDRAIEIVDVKAVRYDDEGRLKVVSHWAKHYRGVIARHAVGASVDAIHDISDLAKVVDSIDDPQIVDTRIDLEPTPTLTVVVRPGA